MMKVLKECYCSPVVTQPGAVIFPEERFENNLEESMDSEPAM